ncbi:MAG: hypothetical protein E2576_02580 [Alcaligenaceae bacterium]|nr:hypothetical protein [Alcaligenaceae bacterium SAGV5]MPS54992.1 hypothetical protein [Alcaligenaceae bacterium SAGV3]MPT55586.1 hypothetical protein [Alcaligenaceae bacterium]
MDWARIVPLSSDPPVRHDAPLIRRGTAALSRKLQEQQTARTEAARNEAEHRQHQVVQHAQARQARQLQGGLLSRQQVERDARQPAVMAVEQASSESEPATSVAFGRGEGGGAGGHDGSPEGAVFAKNDAADGGLDREMLLGWLAEGEENGIFELLLPGGDRLAVAADIGARQACFLLTPSSDRLRALLNRQRVELEEGLAQRMDRHVRLAVL